MTATNRILFGMAHQIVGLSEELLALKNIYQKKTQSSLTKLGHISNQPVWFFKLDQGLLTKQAADLLKSLTGASRIVIAQVKFAENSKL